MNSGEWIAQSLVTARRQAAFSALLDTFDEAEAKISVLDRLRKQNIISEDTVNLLIEIHGLETV